MSNKRLDNIAVCECSNVPNFIAKHAHTALEVSQKRQNADTQYVYVLDSSDADEMVATTNATARGGSTTVPPVTALPVRVGIVPSGATVRGTPLREAMSSTGSPDVRTNLTRGMGGVGVGRVSE